MEYWQRAIYNSERWEKTRLQVIERDRDVCYFCKRIILRKRTIHHLIELSEENYKDESIAFNLDNLVECHKSCHDIYHDRFGKKSIVNIDLDIDYSKRKES